MTSHQTLGLSQSLYDPPWLGGKMLDDQLLARLPSYTHEDAAWLGYDRASSSGNLWRDEIDDWISNGLGRKLVTYNHAQRIVWAGCANVIRAQVGPVSYSAGPLMGITNRASVYYSRKYTDVSPPVVGSGGLTTIAESAESQRRYGILETVFSGGTMTKEEAEQERDVLLEERQWPDKTQDSGNQAGEGSLSVEWLGLVHFLGRFVYNDATPLTTTVRTKILSVLAAEPNGLLSTEYSQVAANAFLTAAFEDQNRYGLDVIQAATALGDVNFDRFLFMVRAKERVYYRPIQATTDIAYVQYLTDYGHEYRLAKNNSRVYPWDLEPGRWVLIADFAPFSAQPSGRRNMRLQFTERVTFTAPYSVQISGGKVEAGPQLLAQLGLGGASA